MIGDSYNKNMKKGQALLIMIMLLATTLTVVLTSTYQSTTETQLTKLEEENQKALAAAEAGIEKALQLKQEGSFVSLGLSNLSGINTFQSSVQINNQGSNIFITPLLQKDEQYTFYLAQYNPQTKNFTGNSIPQDINICFGNSAYNPAIEITLIKTNSIKKYAVNPQGSSIITNGSYASSPNSSDCPDNNFSNKYTIQGSNIDTNSRLLIIRIIHPTQGQTRIGFKAASSFPLQGTIIVSKAITAAGIEKKIQLFQSYPQIPSEFFVTSF